MKNIFFTLALSCISFTGIAQKTSLYFGDPIIADSASTILIPTRNSSDLFAGAKLNIGGEYSNIIIYNFKTDATRKLFAADMYIKAFTSGNNNEKDKPENYDNITRRWIFYFVKPNDMDKSGKIESDDPSVLYVTDRQGNNLKPLTADNENAVDIEVYDKQGFALIKMQRDVDKDNNFEAADRDFYYIKLDLKTLAFGSKIEIN